MINEYIRESMELVKEVDSILSTIKDNVTATRNILKAWEKNYMFDRKDGKVGARGARWRGWNGGEEDASLLLPLIERACCGGAAAQKRGSVRHPVLPAL